MARVVGPQLLKYCCSWWKPLSSTTPGTAVAVGGSGVGLGMALGAALALGLGLTRAATSTAGTAVALGTAEGVTVGITNVAGAISCGVLIGVGSASEGGMTRS